uniref:Glycosyltransferase family 2 protein n=1 Tax=Schlesneria paludicola TaxID=360056 RepID=A0A7C2JZV3_9PLAN
MSISGTHLTASVIIATRNRTDLLAKAAESVAEQDLSDFEVLIVDDGSSSETLEHHRQLVVRLGTRFRLLEPAAPGCRGSGPSGARNRGARAATGEFLAFLDDDDFWCDRSYLRNACEALRSHSADYLFGDVVADRDGAVIRPNWAPPPGETLKGSHETGTPGIRQLTPRYSQYLARARVIHPGHSVVRRTLFEAVGGFFEGLWSNSEDRDLMIRVLDSAAGVLYYQNPILNYRLPTVGSITCSEQTYLHSLQRNLSGQHCRLRCTNEEYRASARASEAWALRQLADLQARNGSIADSMFFALQSVAAYPSLGGLFFLAKHSLNCVAAAMHRQKP